MAGPVHRVFLPNPPIPNPQSPLAVHIRWMISRDQVYVMAIEHDSFDCPWSERDFLVAVQHRDRDGAANVIAMVAETEDTLFSQPGPGLSGPQPGPGRGKIAGFVVYMLKRWRMDVLNFAVHPNFRRRRVGAQMIATLAGKLSPEKRTSIRAEVRETNVAAQLFFRACRFRSVRTLRGQYDDTPEDAYRMVYRPFGVDSPRRHGGDQHG
jgi:ribosomal-protein-alanine N-acetyltransferase